MDLYALVFGKDFRWEWQPGITPLSNTRDAVAGVLIYLGTIWFLRKFMANRPAFELRIPALIHNAFLTVVSFVLLVLMLENIIPKLLQHGLAWTVCNNHLWDDGRLGILFYFNYLTKYYELLDTVFLVLKKKELQFLHVYHHAVTMVLCFVELTGNVPIQWLVISLNLFVHVLMYYYYTCAILKIEIWWKKYLTTLQIVQFVIDLTVVYWATWNGYIWMRLPSFISYSWGPCHGTEVSAFTGCFVLSSYLWLFVDFFYQTYVVGSSSSRRPSSKSSEKSKTD